MTCSDLWSVIFFFFAKSCESRGRHENLNMHINKIQCCVWMTPAPNMSCAQDMAPAKIHLQPEMNAIVLTVHTSTLLPSTCLKPLWTAMSLFVRDHHVLTVWFIWRSYALQWGERKSVVCYLVDRRHSCVPQNVFNCTIMPELHLLLSYWVPLEPEWTNYWCKFVCTVMKLHF